MLANTLLVQFQGSHHPAIERHPAIVVQIPVLRRAFEWLLTHNWDWILATEKEDVSIRNNRYGATVDGLLAAYRAELNGADEGVPKSILQTATPVADDAACCAAPGPAEAAEADGEVPPDAASGAVINTAPSDVLALEQVGSILQQHEKIVSYEGLRAEESQNVDQATYLQLELNELGQARKAIHRLTSSKLREELFSFREQAAGDVALRAKVTCGPDFMSSWSVDFWRKTFVEAFPRGDCAENDGNVREGRVVGIDWSDLLLNQVDKPWFRNHKEWQATAYKYFFRRAQIRQVQLLVKTNQVFKDEVESLLRLRSSDFLDLALKSTDSDTLRKLMRDSTVVQHVRRAMYQVVKVMRSVPGSDSERHKFQSWFEALRIYAGCGVVFWTLNPRDTNSPLTVRFMADGLWKQERIRLDVDELLVHESLEGIRKRSPTALYDMISADTVAACKCFHLTVRLTMEILFNCTRANNDLHRGEWTPLHADGFPCKLTPGIASYLSWYLGITEPQLRKSLHIHAILGLLGFRSPHELFQQGNLAETFVRVWKFVASTCFRSPEAYAASLRSEAAMSALAQEALIPVKKA